MQDIKKSLKNNQDAVVRFYVAFSLATSPDWKTADLKEELLQKICSHDPVIKAAIEGFRSEWQ